MIIFHKKEGWHYLFISVNVSEEISLFWQQYSQWVLKQIRCAVSWKPGFGEYHV